MADYKAIHGKNILHVASDLDSAEGEGQIWFNTTSSDYKTIVKVAGSWSTGGDLNSARAAARVATGTQTAALIAGGGPPDIDDTETYDGSSWTEVNDLNTARAAGSSVGTTAAALHISGDVGGSLQDVVESYDGTNWTEIADINTARRDEGRAGTSTAALIFGGPPGSAIVESWNGTSWTEVGDLNTGRQVLASAGTFASALAMGGRRPGVNEDAVESWNGSAWTELGDLNTGRQGCGGAGTTTDGLTYGGDTGSATAVTENFDGTSWTEVGDLNTATKYLAGLGGSSPASLTLKAGGTAPQASATEEWDFTSTLSAGTWATGTALNTGRSYTVTAGIQPAALAINGGPHP